jgi:hypothetical protein
VATASPGQVTHRAQRIRVEPAGVEVELEPYGVSVLDPR